MNTALQLCLLRIITTTLYHTWNLINRTKISNHHIHRLNYIHLKYKCVMFDSTHAAWLIGNAMESGGELWNSVSLLWSLWGFIVPGAINYTTQGSGTISTRVYFSMGNHNERVHDFDMCKYLSIVLFPTNDSTNFLCWMTTDYDSINM